MAGKKKQVADSAVRKGNAAVTIIIVLLILLVLVGAGIFVMWRMFFGFQRNDISEEIIQKNAQSGSMRSDVSQKAQVDPALVGTWESGCLVPDANSPWSEKHQFIINADGTAQHTRWSSSSHACAPETTLEDKCVVSTPASGRIDFRLIEGTGPDAQDIYQVSGDTLLFGHGFRNNLPYGDGTLNR